MKVGGARAIGGEGYNGYTEGLCNEVLELVGMEGVRRRSVGGTETTKLDVEERKFLR